MIYTNKNLRELNTRLQIENDLLKKKLVGYRSQPTGWVRASEIPVSPKPQYNARTWMPSLKEWAPDVVFYCSDDKCWKRCLDCSVVNSDILEYLSEPLPGELPGVEECMEYAFKVNVDIEKIIRFAKTPKQPSLPEGKKD